LYINDTAERRGNDELRRTEENQRKGSKGC